MASGSFSFSTAQSAVALVTPPVGCFIELTRVSVYCSNANTVNTLAEIGFGTLVGEKNVTGHPGIAPGSGFIEMAPRGLPLGKGAKNEALAFSCSEPTTGSVRVNFGYEVYPG